MTDAPGLRIVAGNPTDEEAAAVAALLQQLLLARAASTSALPADARHGGWIRAGGAVRTPLDRSSGWRAR